MVKVKKEEKEKNAKASDAIKEEETSVEYPSNEALKGLIVKLVPQVDLNRTGVKQFTKKLAAELGGGAATLKNLQSRLDFIKETLSEVINAMEDEEDDDDDEPILQAVSKKARSSSSSNNNNKKAGKAKKPFKSNLATKAEMSEALANFLGKGKMMARTEIVRELWDYIKAHKLQNPENKREIVLDDKMKEVFQVDTFTMFTMNKYIGAHVHPFKPVDLRVNTYIKRNKAGNTAASTPKRKREGDDDDDEGESPENTEGDDRPAKKKRKKKAPGLQPPYRLSPELAAVVGKDILPRPQVISALWEYIKTKDLQDPKDKREIFCDDKLKAVMGGHPKISMFNMNKLLTPHLIEKLDRSQYVHEEKRKDGGKDDDQHDDDQENDEDGEQELDDIKNEGTDEEDDEDGKLIKEEEEEEAIEHLAI